MSHLAITNELGLRLGCATDIQEHLLTLTYYAARCPRIVEFGSAHCNSTWALLAGRPTKMVAYDIRRYDPWFSAVEAAAAGAGIDFRFVIANSAEVIIEPTDLLFIDSEHSYTHCRRELTLHASMVGKFIILHDTVSFAAELKPAIGEFLAVNPAWSVREHCDNCNGLTVLERVSP